MKTNIRKLLLLLFVFCLYGLFPDLSMAEVNVNIGVFASPPPLVIAAPPAMVVIPGMTYVYFAPDISIGLFFYSGYWYRPYEGSWFRARSYRGPWKHINHNSIPPALVKLPPDYREIPPRRQRIPYGQMKENWWGWEKERYWDNRANGCYTHEGHYERDEVGLRNGEHYNHIHGRRP